MPLGDILEKDVPVPALDGMPRMKGSGHGREGPGPNISRFVVESPKHCVGPEGGLERDHVAHRAHAPISPARAPKERLRRIPHDLRGPQSRDAFPFDGTPIGLPLVAEERPTVVGNLERNSHAKEYLSQDISSGVPPVRVVLVEEELVRGDGNVTIHTVKPYPLPSISHGVTVLQYELFSARRTRGTTLVMCVLVKEGIHATIPDIHHAA